MSSLCLYYIGQDAKQGSKLIIGKPAISAVIVSQWTHFTSIIGIVYDNSLIFLIP